MQDQAISPSINPTMDKIYHQISGDEIRRLMRKNKKTIRGVAAGMSITQKRVRQARASGVRGEHFVRDWMEFLVGNN